MTVVSDTSSISNLLQIGLIELLHQLYGEITITPAVERELFAIDEQGDAIKHIEWIKVVTPTDQKMILKLLEDLDLGESESIALALEHTAKYLIIDEYLGRQIADQLGIRIVGILGILIQAKQEGLITEVKMHIEQLRKIGFRINQKLVEHVLKNLGEI